MYIDILIIASANSLIQSLLHLSLCEDKEDLVRKSGTFGALKQVIWCGLQDDFFLFSLS